MEKVAKMNSWQLVGKVMNTAGVTTKNGNTVVKVTVAVMERDGAREYEFTTFKETGQRMLNIRPGTFIAASGALSARFNEYKGKKICNTDLSAFNVEVLEDQPAVNEVEPW
jgi:hypothetical protein